VAQARPTGASENRQPIEHPKSNYAQYRKLDDSNRIKTLKPQQVDELLADGDLALAVKANVAMVQCANGQIEILERTVRDRIKPRPEFCFLKTGPGIGQTLALTIMLETGDIGRFAGVGSQKLSNGKKKGQGNTKNGNKYLSWAFVEAANFAIRFSSRINSFYQRKKAKSHGVVAIKAVAHKLCRACYYIMKNRVAFDVTKAFA
jgi:transposase